MSGRFDRAAIDAAAARGERPRFAMLQLAAQLGAEIVEPPTAGITLFDRLAARLIGRPQHWAMARALRRRLTTEDVIYAGDEAAGLPIAALCGGRKDGPKVVVLVHNIDRPRARWALRLLRLGHKVDRFLAVSSHQVEALRRTLPHVNAAFLNDQTDFGFFRPGKTPLSGRPTIMSVGLEQRNYRALAEATADMNIDVRISGFSSDAQAIANAFPEQLPANMTRAFYEWPDLLALYRSADIVVVSLFPNDYAAGIQVMMEAIACRRPLIVTRTEGLRDYLDRADLVTTVPPNDPAALRTAISAKLADPQASAAQADAAFAYYKDRFSSEAYVTTIANMMRALAAQ